MHQFIALYYAPAMRAYNFIDYCFKYERINSFYVFPI